MCCRLVVPAELGANYIEKGAAHRVCALQAAGENVGSDEAAARGNATSVGDQIIVAPAAAIKALPVPAHGGVQRFVHATEREQSAVSLCNVAAHPRHISKIRTVPR